MGQHKKISNQRSHNNKNLKEKSSLQQFIEFFKPHRSLSNVEKFIGLFIFIQPFLVTAKIIESPFEFIKIFFTAFCVLAVCAYWVFKVLFSEKVQIKYNGTIVVLVLFLLSNLISFSMAKNTYGSFWGDVNLPAGSTFSLLVYIGIVFLIIQLSKSIRFTYFVLSAFCLSAFFLSLYSIIQHFELDPVDWWGYKLFMSRTLATIGQPVALGMFLGSASMMVMTALLSVRNKVLVIALSVAWFLMNMGMFYTGSRGPILASNLLVVGGLLAITIFRKKISHLSFKRILLVFLIFAASQTAYFFDSNKNIVIEKIQPGQMTLGLKSRFFVWRSALTLVTENPIFGLGPEQFANAYNLIRHKDNNYNEAWENSWTKTHNDYLQVLVTAGVVGFTLYMIFILGIFRNLYRAFFKRKRNLLMLPSMGLVLAFCYLLINQFFAFNLNTTLFLFFVTPIAISRLVGLRKLEFINPANYKVKQGAGALLLVLLVYLSFQLSAHWMGVYYYSEATRSYSQGNFVKARELVDIALDKDAGNYKVWCFKASIVFESFRDRIIKKQQISQKDAMETFKDIHDSSNKCTEVGFDHYESWRNRGLLYREFAKVQPDSYKISAEAYKQSIVLSPTNPILYHDMAILYLMGNEVPKAIESLNKSIEMKNDYFQSYIVLSNVYLETKTPQKIVELARGIVHERISSVESVHALEQYLKFLKSKSLMEAAGIVEAHLVKMKS